MNDLVVDAQPSQRSRKVDLAVDLEVLRKIEEDLQDYELLSIFFLMLENFACFDEVYDAYCTRRTAHLPSNLAEGCSGWQSRFFEALCITGCRSTVRDLGQSFDEFDRIYLPKVNITDPKELTTTTVHLGAKLLFKVFDELLSEEQRAELVRAVAEEIAVPPALLGSDLLELHALYWIKKGYIALHSDGYGDLTKLSRHLKKIGLSDHPVYIDVEKYSLSSKKNNKPATVTGNQRAQSHVPPQNERASSPPDLKIIKCALVLIINEVDFPGTDYETRDSSHVDVENLRTTYEGLGYTVKVHSDATLLQIKRIFKDLNYTFDRRKHDGLIVWILSHGVKGHFISYDGAEVSLNSIDDSVCVERLQGLPKIVMVQACQGKRIGRAIESPLTTDGPGARGSAESINILNSKEFLMFSSTMEDCQAIRHKVNGSWFIKAGCDILRMTYQPLSLDKWTRQVKDYVGAERGRLDDGLIAAQLPEVVKDRMIAEVYFPNFNKQNNI